MVFEITSLMYSSYPMIRKGKSWERKKFCKELKLAIIDCKATLDSISRSEGCVFRYKLSTRSKNVRVFPCKVSAF